MKSLDELLIILQKCPDCNGDPWLFITDDKVPCCWNHWQKIADSTIEWSTKTQEVIV